MKYACLRDDPETQKVLHGNHSDWYYSVNGGMRLIFGWNRFRISREGMYSAIRNKSVTDKYIRLTLGAEIKLGDDVWFEMALRCNGPTESYNYLFQVLSR